jgi:hypothetical protein
VRERLRADAWLHPRIEACAAMLMALANDEPANGSGRGSPDARSKKARATDDAFSVFD